MKCTKKGVWKAAVIALCNGEDWHEMVIENLGFLVLFYYVTISGHFYCYMENT